METNGSNTLALTNFESKFYNIHFQDGPVKNFGVNGTTNEEIIDLLVRRITSLNAIFPCRENSLSITHLQEALHWLEHRTRDRQNRGVEGTYSP